MRDRAGKGKEMTELVEKPARTNAKGVQCECELRSESVRVQKPKTRVVELRESVRVVEL